GRLDLGCVLLELRAIIILETEAPLPPLALPLRNLSGMLPTFQTPVGAATPFQVGRNGVVEIVEIAVSLRLSGSDGLARDNTNSRGRQPPPKQISLDFHE